LLAERRRVRGADEPGSRTRPRGKGFATNDGQPGSAELQIRVQQREAPSSETLQLDRAIDAVSEELGERTKATANRSRARKLLADKPDAVAAAYVRRAAAKTREQLRDYGGVKKKMPYFFGVLDQLLTEAAAPQVTTDLAGKYAAKVMR